jgi:hypothetical protein
LSPCPCGGVRIAPGKPCRACRRAQKSASYHKNSAAIRARRNATYRADPAPQMLFSARQRAKAAGVPCTITLADIRAAWPADGRCPALGIELAVTAGRSGGRDSSPSLDRIRPDLGYVPGNIAVVSQLANAIKTSATAPQILAVGRWLERVSA